MVVERGPADAQDGGEAAGRQRVEPFGVDQRAGRSTMRCRVSSACAVGASRSPLRLRTTVVAGWTEKTTTVSLSAWTSSLSPEHEARPCPRRRLRRPRGHAARRRVGPARGGRPRRSSGGSATLGFLGLTIPEELGGSGGDHLSYCLVLEELGRGDSSVRGIVSVSLGLVAKTIAAHGIRRAAADVAAPALRRRGAGLLRADRARHAAPTPPTWSTRAVRDGDDWLLDRHQGVHHQRHLGRRRAGLRPHRRPRPARRHRVPRRRPTRPG